MKKITLIFGMLFTSILSFGQICEQTFTADGTDNDTVLSIQNSELNCYSGNINSISIAEADLGYYCGDWFTFSIDIDGVVTENVCSEDLEGMMITNFSSITITASDLDEYEDDLSIELTIAVNYTPTSIPNCDAILTSPVDGSTDNDLLGILEWSPATGGIIGYKISVGTTAGGTEIINMQDLGNVTTFDIPGMLAQDTQYFVNIISYNTVGDAIGCTEYNFETATFVEGVLCENAIEIDALPFNTQDDTVNYADVYYEGTPGASGCGSTYSYLNGNDVVYTYTATFDGSINITLTPDEDNTYSGIFIYDSCENIGSECIGGVANSSDEVREILEYPVQLGQTYYFVISTWASPQTVSYTLDISENTCTNATAAYSIVSDCANGEQFLVSVEITDLGTATSLSVSDDLGSESQTISETGTLTFGPYDNNIPVVITVTNSQDSSCVINSEALTQTICPPANDTCITAFDLTNEISPIEGTTVGATNANTTTCNSAGEDIENTYGDVFYSILVPEGSTLSIGQTLNDYDSSNIIFYGDCDNRNIIDCFDDSDYKTVEWSNNTGSDQTVYWIQDGHSGTGTYTLEWSMIDCIPSEATYTVVSDCSNGDQFLVEVNVTNLGSATSLSVYDDYGSDGQTATQTGILTFGPYANQTEVIFTLENDQNSDCVITSAEITQNACPPANDECLNAELLTVNTNLSCETVASGTVAGATASTVEGNTCYGTADDDVWYSFAATHTSHQIKLTNVEGSTSDLYHSLWTGTCDDLTLIEDSCSDGNTSNPSELIVGQIYYVRVYTYTSTSGQNTTFDICIGTPPPPPANDDCSGAIALTTGSEFETNPVIGTNVSATPSQLTNATIPIPTCGTYSGGDVWYSVLVPASGSITVETNSNTDGVITDTVMQIYSGTCDELISVECDDDDSEDGYFSKINLVDRTPGEVLYVRVFEYGNDVFGSFKIAAYDASLSNGNFDKNAFVAYPNPVKNVLNVSFSQNITEVTIYNILGQQVVFKTINANEGQIDMSNLTSGTYLVKVKSDNVIQTLKVVKE